MKKQTASLHGAVLSAIHSWLEHENSLFSNIVESKVTNRQVLLLGQTCLVFFCLVCVSSNSPIIDLLFLLWFAKCLDRCRKGGLR